MDNDLYEEIQKKNSDLEIAIRKIRQNGNIKAEKDKAYHILLRTEVLKLKEKGMAVTLIDMVVKGIPEVAQARFERDAADAVYQANLEAVQAIKLQLRLLDSQLSREYSVGGV